MICNTEIETSRKREYDFKIVASIGLLISVFLLVFSYYIFGSFFESNDDPRYVLAMKGLVSPLPFEHFFGAYKFTAILYGYLYKHFPEFGWYGFSMFFLLWAALFNIYITFYLVSKSRINFLLFIMLFITFYFSVFFQNSYCINFARPVILVSSSFVILLGVLYLHAEVLRKNKWILFFPIITFIFAHFTRLDTGYLGFVFGLVFSVLLIFKEKALVPFLLKFIVPFLLFFALLETEKVYSATYGNVNNLCWEKSELIRKLIDYKNGSEYVPKDVKDQIAYESIMVTYYFGDDNIFTLDYLKRLTFECSLLKSGREKKFREEYGTFSKSLDNENSAANMLNYGLLAIFIISFFLSMKGTVFYVIRVVLFQLFFYSIILGLCYYLKLPARIFNPLVVMLTFGNLVFAFSFLHFTNKLVYWILVIPLVLFFYSIPTYINKTKERISYYKEYGRVNQMMIDDLNKTFQNTIFIPTNGRAWEMHAATDPIKEINFKNNNSYVYLSIELSLTPEIKDQLSAKFGTSDHSKLFRNIKEMDNVIFISDESYNYFLSAYYHYFYSQDYTFEKVFIHPPLFYQYTGLNYYRIKR